MFFKRSNDWVMGFIVKRQKGITTFLNFLHLFLFFYLGFLVVDSVYFAVILREESFTAFIQQSNFYLLVAVMIPYVCLLFALRSIIRILFLKAGVVPQNYFLKFFGTVAFAFNKALGIKPKPKSHLIRPQSETNTNQYFWDTFFILLAIAVCVVCFLTSASLADIYWAG